MIASPEYVLAVLELLDEDVADEEPDDEPDGAVGSWPAESADEAADEPEEEPVLSELLLVVVTWRLSAATMAVELREVL
ncbi:hypothetical protein GCM10009817_07370 [Terrabacter lapilli]|uniref:Uncharacterized protein n=1 Tax=Terrabacter lapilli TaxID=436231 RepID=A0ABN2RJ01_9MICO